MSKFLTINAEGEVLNADMIARIVPVENGGCVIMTKDGQQLHSEFDLHMEVDDGTAIRSIIPCSGISAVFLGDDGDTAIRPTPFVLLLSNGKIEPFIFATDEDLEFLASEGETGFVGFVPTK